MSQHSTSSKDQQKQDACWSALISTRDARILDLELQLTSLEDTVIEKHGCEHIRQLRSASEATTKNRQRSINNLTERLRVSEDENLRLRNELSKCHAQLVASERKQRDPTSDLDISASALAPYEETLQDTNASKKRKYLGLASLDVEASKYSKSASEELPTSERTGLSYGCNDPLRLVRYETPLSSTSLFDRKASYVKELNDADGQAASGSFKFLLPKSSDPANLGSLSVSNVGHAPTPESQGGQATKPTIDDFLREKRLQAERKASGKPKQP